MQHQKGSARPMGMMTAKMDRKGTAIGFEVDQQTWKDIDLFDQGGRGPVFSLFGKLNTSGGELALERLLKTPSNHRTLLEGRRDIIRWFRDRNIDLRIGREQTNKIEQYLACGYFLFPPGRPAALLYAIRNQLKQRPAYSTIIAGVRATVSLTRYIFGLRAKWLAEGCPAQLEQQLNGLPEMVTELRVRALLLGPAKQLKMMDLARCDHFFRGPGRTCLRHLIDLLYEWDAFQATAAVAQQHNWTFPLYDESTEPAVRIKGLFHPLLNDPVANDFEIGQEANLCVISGAHMAGKTTFLKSFGLAVYLAHAGFPVPACFMQLTLFNGLITSVNLTETILQGYSHFYAEVRRLKDVVRQMGERRRMVVIMDELFRGTNIKDASDASLRVIDGLANIEDNLLLISTHIVEITDRLGRNRNIRFACMESTIEGGVPWYSYRLKNGVSDERIGITILQNEGILDMLQGLCAANERGPDFDVSKVVDIFDA